MTSIQTISNGDVNRHDDEIVVEMLSALGLALGHIIMPDKMKGLLIKAYLDSGTVRSTYMYIDGKEVSDGKNYNPYHGIG